MTPCALALMGKLGLALLRGVEILVGIMDSVLQNLRDLLQYTVPVEDLEINATFLKNFILFAMSRGLDHGQMKDLLIHIEALVLDGARFTFMSWYDLYHKQQYGLHRKMMNNIYQLIDRIKPYESHVGRIYVAVLQEASKSELYHHPFTRSHRVVLGNFVDSLLILLADLFVLGTSHVNKFYHQMQNLLEEMTFLRTILREHHIETMQHLIEVVICDAGILIFNLFVESEDDGALIEKLELLFSDLEEKFKLILPQTSVVGFVDSVLGKMKLVSGIDGDSGAWIRDNLQSLHDDLTYLRSLLATLMAQCNLNEKLQTLKNRIVLITKETDFVLDSSNSQTLVWRLNTIMENVKLTKADALETYSKMSLEREIPMSNEHVVGLDDAARRITDVLERGTRHVDIISIVGMPGLGKTTLAKKVYSDPAITLHFHIRSWCHVSQVYTKKNMLLEILRGACNSKLLDKHFLMNDDDLAEELCKHLKGKRYLFVLDDVWDIASWESLKNSLPDDNTGSRILLTSRDHRVALQINSDGKLHHLRWLNDDESWKLLQKRLCIGEDCPPQLVSLGKEISQNCKGSPLMVLVVAGLLLNMQQATWEEVAKSLRGGTLSITEQCRETLELSFSHLPHYLKPCFLYFGAFHECLKIPVRNLLWLWIAEGLVEKTERARLEDVAEEYMMELTQRSLVMVAEKGSRGRAKSCILHDLLRDFCKAKCNEENFLHSFNGNLVNTIEPRILYGLHIYPRRDDSPDSRLCCPRLRTLLVVSDDETWYQRHRYNILYKGCESELLQFLDLKRLSIAPFFPRVVELHFQLRYLALALYIEGEILTIPSSIANLSNLQTFIVEGSGLRVSLPDTVWNMENLRQLCISESACWELSQERTKNHSNLETLSTVSFPCGHKMEEVMRKFPNIRRLRCNLVMAGACTGDCKVLALDFLSQLESLTLSQIHKEFHDLSFHFPRNLKKLVLSNFLLPWSKISLVDGLPNLEVLKLLENAFAGKLWDMGEGKFPKLRFLKLADLDIVQWTNSNESFPCLEKLVLERCQLLEEIPSHLAYIPTLQLIEVSDCGSAMGAIKQIQEEYMKSSGDELLKILFHPPQWEHLSSGLD
ncbi:OLC1v1038066C1 [Oldenlandia corymbosa var. corymbosa]|uniref:OLC1v1038066C1 n=1 Tax=Oldenlandia corymbosa var. corymbosa TaxID=529605 RepID=A0AAV1CYX7_OLDCO|nr:OLC1v1038066C1 [Oldenlandia corymbosa var. corymbosa]